ncbi:galactose mutarotase-like isoform X1 [Lytechinus pictus]|uniref:galactose mutarotase-like isoform X1 n=1 Tax=Lytechinus pictus TaxID=7653 RepID=UPI0030BA0172
MPVTKEEYGHTANNQLVEQYTLSNVNGLVAKIINYGAAITELWIPDKNGKIDDVVLGWPDIKGYESNSPYFGVIVGRVANRIANGQFSLDGVAYQLEINNGPNHIHGGVSSFSHRVWDVGHINGNGVSFSYTSPDGENSYPGEVTITINYQLTNDNKLIMSYAAKTTKATPINLTNHSYFNLGGHDSGSVLDHIVEIDSDKYTPIEKETSIPTGEISCVDNTVFDLRSPTRLKDKIKDVPGLGYDHNFCVKSSERPCATVTYKESGRKMKVYTTKPGIQFYTANYLNDSTMGKHEAVYPKHSALCLESQFYPNSVNQPNFPSCILHPGDTYKHETTYAFSWN